MKNFQILHLNLILVLSFISSTVFASTEAENIWLYVFLIPVYFVLAAQALLVLLAMLMKNFKTKQLVFMSIIAAIIFMTLGLGVTYYHETTEKLLEVLLHFSVIGIIVFILPVIQYKLLSHPKNITEKN